MKGLAITILRKFSLENLLTIGSEYYLPEFVERQHLIRSQGTKTWTLREISKLITDGDHGVADYQESGIPFILSENVKEGWIDTSGLQYVSREHHASLPRSALRAGDVVVTKTGVYFGKSAVIPEEFGEANTIAHVGIIRLKQGYDPYYISTFLNSKYGYSQLRRRGIKATRPEIKLIEFGDIEFVFFGKRLERGTLALIQQSFSVRQRAAELHRLAERILLASLGLADWKPPEPLAYSAKSANVRAAARLDAQFYAPRIQQLVDLLSLSGSTVGAVAKPRRERFKKDRCETFDYIEIGDIETAGTAGSSHLQCAEAPSRATWHVHTGDVITTMVRPIRRLSAQIAAGQDGHVCSSGFVVLQPTGIAPEVLLTFLRLPAICELMDLYTSASMYPAISETDILALPFPTIQQSTTNAICAVVQQSRESCQRARDLLNRAKHAVEIAIEDSEAAALRFLDEAGA